MSCQTRSYPDGNGNSEGSHAFPFAFSRFPDHWHAEERCPQGKESASVGSIRLFPRAIVSRMHDYEVTLQFPPEVTVSRLEAILPQRLRDGLGETSGRDER